MIVPNALNLQLPGNKKSTPQSKSTPTSITIKTNRSFTINGNTVSKGELERMIRELKRSKGKDAVVSITPDGKSHNDDLVAVLDMARRYQVKTSLNNPR